jgi:hypothetical protein
MPNDPLKLTGYILGPFIDPESLETMVIKSPCAGLLEALRAMESSAAARRARFASFILGPNAELLEAQRAMESCAAANRARFAGFVIEPSPVLVNQMPIAALAKVVYGAE